MTAEPPFFQEKPNILIVDDTLPNLELLSGLLEDKGYEARPVPSGALALSAVQAEAPDLILLDINMPEMNGFEVCKRLKGDESTRDIPVIFLTALTETTDKVMGFSLGAVDYITKPFQFEEVMARVETHLRIRHLQRQLHHQNENLTKLVEERTRDLARANERLQVLGHLKDDFFRMISFEIRTPANGVIGIGNLLIDQCPSTEESRILIKLFRDSCTRLTNLIDDTSFFANNEGLSTLEGTRVSMDALLEKVQAALPEIQISMDPKSTQGRIFLKGDLALLKRALQTIILLAVSFSEQKQSVQIKITEETGSLRVKIDLDDLTMKAETAGSFFELEAPARAVTSAEPLGLAPVVAHKIISAFGGELKLVKEDGSNGSLQVVLIREPDKI